MAKQDLTPRRPSLSRNSQEFIWELRDALARCLRDPRGGEPGDARWTVSGLSNSIWTINHPELENLESGESPLKLRIKKIGNGRWAVFGQNQLSNLLNTKTIMIRKTPPGGADWDVDDFARRVAEYFQQQKQDVTDLQQALTPQAPPGVGYPPPGGQQSGGPGGVPGGGMPLGSRVRPQQSQGQPRGPGGQRRVAGGWAGGWWVGPDSTVLDIGEQDHTSYLEKNIQFFGPGIKTVNDAERAGWLRVRQYSDPALGIMSVKSFGPQTTQQAFEMIQGLVARSHEPRVFAFYGDRLYKLDRDDFLGLSYPGEVRRLGIQARVSQVKESRKANDDLHPQFSPLEVSRHKKLADRVYRFLLKRKRPYSSVKYLARKLGINPYDLARALGRLVVEGRIDMTNKKFRPLLSEGDADIKVKEKVSTRVRSGKCCYKCGDGCPIDALPEEPFLQPGDGPKRCPACGAVHQWRVRQASGVVIRDDGDPETNDPLQSFTREQFDVAAPDYPQKRRYRGHPSRIMPDPTEPN